MKSNIIFNKGNISFMPSLFQLNINVGGQQREKDESKWEETRKPIKVDLELDVELIKGLWTLLEDYADVFAWNERELGCCMIGEHMIDIQGFFLCRTSLNMLSFWEEIQVNRQIQTLMHLGNMRPSTSKYTYKVTLLIKKDINRLLCGDYCPLNMKT